MSSNKLTYEEVKKYVEDSGYELLSTTYVRALNNLTFKCPNGHVFERRFSKFKTNKKCPYCQGIRHWTYEEVKEYIESFGYKLLSKEYHLSTEKIKVQCDKGHVYEVTFANFKYGKRCPICANNRLLTYENVKEYIESFDYKLISKEYINANSHLEVECPEGHRYKVKFGNFKTGYRCPTCGAKIVGEARKYSYDEVKEYIESFEYKLLSKEYTGIHDHLEVECPEGHKYKVTFSNFKMGTRCPICNDNSKGEKLIRKYLDENNISYINDRRYFKDLISARGTELRPDFIIEDEKIWIEFDGEQHYKIIKYFGGLDKFITLKIHDTMKDLYAEEHGWKMIRIPYWEINNIKTILDEELKIS